MKQDIIDQINLCIKSVDLIARATNESVYNAYTHTRQCPSYCPTASVFDKQLADLENKLQSINKDAYIKTLSFWRKIIKAPNNCVNLEAFGAIRAVLSLLMNLIDVNSVRKIFISHSSVDAKLIECFVKEILMLGCGFKESDIFCTLDHTAIRTGDDFRNEIVEKMKGCDYIFLMISDNYQKSEVCQNEVGAAWALDNKRILPFVFPNVSFKDIGFLNVVKQGAKLNDRTKLDELYKELADYYNFTPDWINFNKRTSDFLDSFTKE